MPPSAVRSVSEVDPATQELLARLFGKELTPNREVMFTLLESEDSPADAKRTKAWATINQILDKAATTMKDVAEGDFDAAVVEAMQHARPRHGS